MMSREEGAACADVRALSRAWGCAPLHELDRRAMPPRLARATRAERIHVLGELPAVHAPAIGIVGTRRIPVASMERLSAFVRTIVDAAGCVVVSGGAFGVDVMAHEAAIAVGAPTVVVLASGLLRAGPRANVPLFRRVLEEGGALVSDKPHGRRPFPSDFLERNALVASMSDALVVVAAPLDSGAMRTARDARRFGCPVLAVPGPPWDETFAGNHELLRRGARICASPEDVLLALGRPTIPGLDGVASVAPEAAEAGERDGGALGRLRAAFAAGQTLDAAARALGLSAAEAQTLALELELGAG